MRPGGRGTRGAEGPQLVAQRDDFAVDLGGVLRSYRLSRGLSLQCLAAVSDGRFGSSVLGAYERGERDISLRRFCDLARCLGEDPPRLLAEALAARQRRGLAVTESSAEGSLTVRTDDPDPGAHVSFARAPGRPRERRGERSRSH